MKEKSKPPKPGLVIVVLVITVIAQVALSIKYWFQDDMVGGIIALGTAIIWAIIAIQRYRSVMKK